MFAMMYMNMLTQVFARTLTSFGFRCRIISVKLLVFGVKMLSKKVFLVITFY